LALDTSAPEEADSRRIRYVCIPGSPLTERSTEPFTGVIVGARADEERSRSKEQYFSDRTAPSQWDVGDQPPEFWDQFKTEFAPGTHLRIHPLLDWTELNI
jgi:sulfate adenylyltransferase subunit 2